MSEERGRKPGNGLRILVVICLLASLSSLALNAFLIYNLGQVRETARTGIDATLEALGAFEESGFHYEYHFEEVIPFSADIPFEQEMVFPFEGTVPISTTVEVPFNAGILGNFVFPIPIDMDVPIDTSVPVRINEVFQFSTSLPISVVIPVDIEPGEPQTQEVLGNIREWLLQLRDSF
jgi:hypothetical protein